MLTYQEQIELREKIISSEISIETAKQIYWKDFKDGYRSWHTKDWKVRRKKCIKDRCQICSSNRILTIQHLSHPKKYRDYKNYVSREYATHFIDEAKEVNQKDLKRFIKKNYIYQTVPLCPNCGARNPNLKVGRSPRYLCKKCHSGFEEATKRSVDDLIHYLKVGKVSAEIADKCFVSKDEWRNKLSISEVKYWFQRGKATEKDSAKIEREAFLLYLDDNIKYLSFQDTITACKKCAAYFDLYNMKICPKCKEYYMGVQYPTCIQCLPEDKRKIALEKVAFGKNWRDREKELGID